MKNKYLWLTPIIAAAHKIFITGFYQNEIAHGKLIPIVVNTLTFSALIFVIPFIITVINSVKTKQFLGWLDAGGDLNHQTSIEDENVNLQKYFKRRR
jgi:hypothetical protein